MNKVITFYLMCYYIVLHAHITQCYSMLYFLHKPSNKHIELYEHDIIHAHTLHNYMNIYVGTVCHFVIYIIRSSHDSQYTLPLLLHMIVTLLPVIVMLVSLPDPIVVVLFRTTDSDVILMIVLLSILSKAVDSEEHVHSPFTQHCHYLLLTIITLLYIPTPHAY